MAALDTGPCEAWPTLCTNYPSEATQTQIDDAEEIATEYLWYRSKQQFGLCSMKLRPCRKECLPSGPLIFGGGWPDIPGVGTYPTPALVGGQWLNLTCGSCTSGCSCSELSEVQLPYPVANVTEVKVDGAVLPPTAYRVDNWELLVRVDGGQWPTCNDLNLPDTEFDTWSVTAQYGTAVPKLGQLAAGQLATEIVKRCIGASGCKLPAATVQQVSRQGVTKTFFDAGAFANGKIGLYYPDMFLATFNPMNTGVATIFDIDGPRARRVGT